MAAVIGGIGNVRGAVLGGFVIAFVEQFGAFYLSSDYRDVYVFALLIRDSARAAVWIAGLHGAGESMTVQRATRAHG